MAWSRGVAVPKQRPAKLERDQKRTEMETLDEKESAKARLRAGGRCEIIVEGEGRCVRRDLHTHHMISGWKLRARGASALATHKQRTCKVCHDDIEGHVLTLHKPHQPPQWNDTYERAR